MAKPKPLTKAELRIADAALNRDGKGGPFTKAQQEEKDDIRQTLGLPRGRN